MIYLIIFNLHFWSFRWSLNMFHFAGFKGCILRLEVENKKVTITMMILTHDFEHDDSDVVINND